MKRKILSIKFTENSWTSRLFFLPLINSCQALSKFSKLIISLKLWLKWLFPIILLDQAPPRRSFSRADLPVIGKTADAFKLWHNFLPHIPKLTRYSLREKITQLFIEVAELIFTAGFAAKENKALIIKKASLKLDLLKFFLQITWELRAIDDKKFAAVSASLAEVGKMLGGWQKQLTKTPPDKGGEQRLSRTGTR